MNINFTSPINTLGYGVVGLHTFKSLVENGHQVSLWPIGNLEAEPDNHGVIIEGLTRAKLYDVDAPSVRLWHQFDLSQHIGRGERIGWSIFELFPLQPNELYQMRNMDKLIVCSNWAKEVLENDVKSWVIGTYVVPLGVDRTIFHEKRCRNSGPFTFLNIGKWEIRKGHDILLEAFNLAFEPSDDVQLNMHCYNPFLGGKNKEWEDMYMSSKMGKSGKIKVSTSRVDTFEEVAIMMSAADCGVFPARAEGWNLELLEMMSVGRPVITTNYSGHTEFCNTENSYLIDVKDTELAYDEPWFRGQGYWANLDDCVDQLVEYMRTAYKTGYAINIEGIKTAEKFPWKNTAEKLVEAILS